MIDLTIVIVSYETKPLTLRCLESIDRARLAHPALQVETIVVDNGSQDGSAIAARDSPTAPRTIALVRNRGFAAAVNRALRIARGRHVLLLNSDAEVEPNVLSQGVALLDESTDIGVLGTALVHPDGRPQRSVHAFPGLQSELLAEPILRLVRPAGFSTSAGRAKPVGASGLRDVEAVRGAVFFIRGDLLEKVGLLDEGYFFFLEETDYCWRIRAAGYRVCQSEGLCARHQLGASSKQRVRLATRIEFHRALYRFLERRRGPVVAAISRGTRTLRAIASGLALLLPAVASSRARSRFAERVGLLLWHLRGCPRRPDFANALRAAGELSATRSGDWRLDRRVGSG
jgi:GT2 family glycosyltransferase